jgi:glycosyltransferase involved in cell wall biosynthesis
MIAISQFVADRYRAAGVREDLIDVVPDGIDCDRYSPAPEATRDRTRRELGIGDDSTLILFAGRLVPEKGIEVLLDGFQRLRRRDPTVRLVIAGCPPAPRAAARDYARRLRERRGPWTWAPAAGDVVPYYAASDVVVVPSKWQEPLGRVPLEAMACGRPAVATRVGGLPEALGGDLGERLMVDPDDPEALADALARIARWRSEAPDLGARCRDHVSRNFSLERHVRGVESAFEAAIEWHRRHPVDNRLARLRDWAGRSRRLASARA